MCKTVSYFQVSSSSLTDPVDARQHKAAPVKDVVFHSELQSVKQIGNRARV